MKLMLTFIEIEKVTDIIIIVTIYIGMIYLNTHRLINLLLKYNFTRTVHYL